MKLIAILLIIVVIYLNNEQIKLLQMAKENVQTEQVATQLNMNIFCSYVFSLFMGLLIFFVIKSFLI